MDGIAVDRPRDRFAIPDFMNVTSFAMTFQP